MSKGWPVVGEISLYIMLATRGLDTSVVITQISCTSSANVMGVKPASLFLLVFDSALGASRFQINEDR